MNKFNFSSIIIILLFLLIICGCTEYIESLTEEDKNIQVNDKDVSLIQSAYQNNDLKICMEIEDLQFKEQCIHELAIWNNDPLICEDISDERFNSEQVRCFIKLAHFNDNQDICMNIKDINFREECLFTIAYKLNDVSVCNSLSSGNKEICINNIGRSLDGVDFCLNKSEDEDIDMCLFHLAMNELNTEICDMINHTLHNSRSKFNCKSNIKYDKQKIKSGVFIVPKQSIYCLNETQTLDKYSNYSCIMKVGETRLIYAKKYPKGSILRPNIVEWDRSKIVHKRIKSNGWEKDYFNALIPGKTTILIGYHINYFYEKAVEIPNPHPVINLCIFENSEDECFT